MQLTVIGAGYVGLVAAAGFAKMGHRVFVVESDDDKLELLRNGGCPIYEPGLEELLRSEAPRLSFGSDLASALAESEACFVCVGTPQAADGSADLTATKAALEAVARAMRGYLVIVLKSTVPPGTHELSRRLVSALTSHDFDIVSNPEFLREGSAVTDFLMPERIVLGLASSRPEAVMRELYAPVIASSRAALVVMDNASAEITKYAANAMLATRISFMNEIANLCESLGADVSRVREGMKLDRRIGPLFLDAGVGYGGCCFPKDVRALLQTAARTGNPLKILAAVDSVNRAQRLRLVDKVAAHFADGLSGVRLALWGLAFKPNTDDVRDAPALTIAEALVARGAQIAAYDPKANRRALAALGAGVTVCADAFTAAAGADALIVATEWPEFVDADLLRLRSQLRHPVVFDGRNLWHPERMARYVVTGGAGFIGSHLCERLVREGHHVVCVDNLVTGSLSNLLPIRGNTRFEVVIRDVAASLSIAGRVDGVLHLASPASPVDYLELPLETLRTGSLGSFAALELARDKQCPILLTSTSEVYGDPEQHPQRETYFGNVNPIGPRSVYDEAKRFMEACAMAYQRKYGLPVRLARIFNTYGPRMRLDDGRVVPNFVSQALRGEALTVYGQGQQTRSFCYVDDMVEGLLRLFHSTVPLPVNLGNPVEHTILDFAHVIIRAANSRSTLVFRELPVDDPKQRRPDIGRARELLGFEPATPLDLGIQRTIDYFRNALLPRSEQLKNAEQPN